MLDLEESIVNLQKAIKLTGNGHPDLLMYLADLGDSQRLRFGRLGEMADLEDSISNLQKAVTLTNDAHQSKSVSLSNLGISLYCRFECLGKIADLEGSISNLQKAVALCGDGHAHGTMYLSNLGNNQRTRFEHLGKMEDLEDSISNLQKVVGLTDDHHPNKAKYLSNLAGSQQRRFECLGTMADLEDSISNVQNAVALIDNDHPNKSLYLSNLGGCQQRRFERLGEMADLEGAISNVQKAVAFTDDSHPNKPNYLSNLGVSQRFHFNQLGKTTDLENSISNLQKAVALTDDGHANKSLYFSNLGISQQCRFKRLGDMADLEGSITNLKKAVAHIIDHSNRSMCLSNLGISHRFRFERLGEMIDLEDSISNLKQAVALIDNDHPNWADYLSNLGNSQQLFFNHLGKIRDLEDSISNLKQAVDLTDDVHPNKAAHLLNLSSSQKTRFEHLGGMEDLEDSISNLKKAVALTDDSHPNQALYFLSLGNSQRSRFERLGEVTDLVATVSAYQAAAQSKTGYPRHTLIAARHWAEVSYDNGDLSFALEGFRTALAILPKVAWLGLDTTSRQDWLIDIKSEELSCLSATCAIKLGLLEEGVELLDLGRSVFWQQASSLRSDLGLLRDEAPELARKLESVGQRLDAGHFSSLISNIGEQNTVGHNMTDIGRARRHLVGVWEDLLEEVRRLPKFEYFLRPMPFRQLRQAATTGTVIIINVSQYGVDAIIFDATYLIEHVPLSNIDFETVTELSSNILLKRPANATAERQRRYMNSYFKPALRTVYNDIIVPIFDHIQIPWCGTATLPQRRIRWYVTGPLTFIPIHAAGSGGVDVTRLVISSYVTTLSSLFQVQKNIGISVAGSLKLLAVSQPDTPGQMPLPISTEEVEKIVEVACLAGWSKEDIVCLDGLDATVNCVSHALDTCSWVHFACHGVQDPFWGMKSAFALHNGALELSQIASKRLSSGQFAFLSVCHGASGLQDLPGEAMHLAAGIQFAGFPSVIATLWSISDEDAPKVAHQTYKYLLRNGLEGRDPSEAATALNRAILSLREDPKVTIDRWAPFIHFGI